MHCREAAGVPAFFFLRRCRRGEGSGDGGDDWNGGNGEIDDDGDDDGDDEGECDAKEGRGLGTDEVVEEGRAESTVGLKGIPSRVCQFLSNPV